MNFFVKSEETENVMSESVTYEVVPFEIVDIEGGTFSIREGRRTRDYSHAG